MKENINKIAKYFGWLFLLILILVLLADFLRRGIFQEQVGMNLLVVGDENVGMLIMRPKDNSISWVSLPTNLKIKIFNSSATYPIKSLWKFGQSENKPFDIIEKSIGMAIGVELPRMIKVDRVASVDQALGKFLSISAQTDLSWKDRWTIYQYVSDAAVSKKIFELEVPQTAMDKVQEADGKEFLVFNPVINLWTKDKFYHEAILEENADISINNVSDTPGMALGLSRQLESSGMHVIEVINNPQDTISEKGCFFLASNKNQVTKTFLQNQAECMPLPKKEGKETGENLIKIWIR